MSRYSAMTMAVAVAGAAVLMSSPAGARTLTGVIGAGGAWGKAEEVPGTAALNTNGNAAVSSVSCASAGNCSAGGYYFGPGIQPFVVSQVNGVWGKAEKVPGIARLNKFNTSETTSVSCSSAGNCSAGGYYLDGNTGSEQEAFVASQVNGTWGKAEEVPGTAKLNTFGGTAAVTAMSCGSAGACSAGGYYTDSSDLTQAFVVSQVNGVWGKAEKVPGTPALNLPGAEILSLSCASGGNCSAVGDYISSTRGQAFVVSQVNGTWGKAEKIPGISAPDSGASSISCASAGNCSAGGGYSGGATGSQAYVVSQINGVWTKAEEVPGTARLNKGNAAEITSVSCASAGDCSAGGNYTDGASHLQAFVVSQAHGAWGKAEEVPGIDVLNGGHKAFASAVSCGAAGDCSAGGGYTDSSGRLQVFVVSQAHGVWGKAEEVPGTARLNKGNAEITSVSCTPGGHCSAGGHYTDGSGHQQAFVVSRS